MKNLIDSIVEMNKGAKFASFTYRNKSAGELAKYNLIIGFSYHNAVKESLNQLCVIKETLTDEVELQAANELIESFNNTLIAHAQGTQNDAYTKKGQYLPVGNGLNVNKNDGSFQFFGLVQSKTVLEEGTYKEVKSSAKTLAKKKLSKSLPISKFREFSLSPDCIKSARLNGETIEIE